MTGCDELEGEAGAYEVGVGEFRAVEGAEYGEVLG